MSLVKNIGLGIHALTNKIIDDLVSDYTANHNKPSYPFADLTGLEAANRTIRGLFGQYCHYCNSNVEPMPNSGNRGCRIPLTPERIYARLVAIDSLFSTNTNKGYYIKQNMTDAIWEACKDGKGGHSDDVLAIKASNYILWTINHPNAPQPQNTAVIQQIEDLLYGRFAWVEKTEDHKQTELSLMTKYLHYLVEEVRPNNTVGFPIYDSLIVTILPKVYKYVLGKDLKTDFPNATKPISQRPYSDYVQALWKIVDTLMKASNGNVWNRTDMTPFHISDLFLWQLGKVYDMWFNPRYKGKVDYKRLWMLVTQDEFDTMLHTGQIIPRLNLLENLAKKI